jgi:hypothetical protein
MSAVFGEEEEKAAEKLQRAWSHRLLFDPRSLGGELETGFKSRATIIESPEPVADPLTMEEQRRMGHEILRREYLKREFLRQQGVDVDDAERERWSGRKFDDNKTESQIEREESETLRPRTRPRHRKF